MADREKVLRAIEHHANSCYYHGSKCPYADDLTTCIKRLLADAAELLQEPEPVQVEVHETDQWHGPYLSCPECGTDWITYEDRVHYCPNCGRRVVWEVHPDGRT